MEGNQITKWHRIQYLCSNSAIIFVHTTLLRLCFILFFLIFPIAEIQLIVTFYSTFAGISYMPICKDKTVIFVSPLLCSFTYSFSVSLFIFGFISISRKKLWIGKKASFFSFEVLLWFLFFFTLCSNLRLPVLYFFFLLLLLFLVFYCFFFFFYYSLRFL